MLIEVQKMNNTMSEVLKIAYSRKIVATNIYRRISELGTDLDKSYNNILNELPHIFWEDFYKQKPDGENEVDIQKYITSLIDGTALSANVIDTEEYTTYKKTLAKLQEYIKCKIAEIEDDIK